MNFRAMFNESQIASIIQAAKKAGDTIMDYYNNHKSIDVATKNDNSEVTKADLVANNLLIESLSKSFPDVAIVSEENSREDNQKAAQSKKFFVIDPLDGTSSFIKKSDQFTVNIALVENYETVFGVIYAPAMDLMYYTDHNQNSVKISDFSSSDSKKSQISVSGKKEDLLVICTKRDPERSEIILDMQSSNKSIKEIVSVSSSYKFCLIAEGAADYYPRRVNIKAWDVAAGHAIVKRAGGNMISYFSKEEVRYDLEKGFEVNFFEVF